MSKTPFFKNLATQLSDLLPAHLGALKKDFQKNCHSKLQQIFTQLDLVTREEFDIQNKVLIRTRKKVETLEAQVKKLEDRLKTKRSRGS